MGDGAFKERRGAVAASKLVGSREEAKQEAVREKRKMSTSVRCGQSEQNCAVH